MSLSPPLPIIWLASLLSLAPAVWAQQNEPHVGYVYPAGGRRGSTFQIQVGGQFLDRVAGTYVSGGGVRAAVVKYDKPLTPGQINDLRQKIRELQGKGREALQEMADIRRQIFASLRRNANPVIAEIVTLEVTVAPEAEPGRRELRLRTPLGVSNPLVFCIGQLPEFSESPPGSNEAETRISLPAVVNGRIIPGGGDLTRLPPRPRQQFLPGDVDRFRFQAHRGQHLVAVVSARNLIPYLADAVPGWFQATLALCDADGKEVAYDDDYRFHPDPVLHYEIPKDGEYTLEIKDALHRGREDFVYRIEVGELPFITGIFPLGGRAGTRVEVQLEGWNLKHNKMTVDAAGKGPAILTVSAREGETATNSLLFAEDTLPECFESEPNDSEGQAQPVKIPVIVNGRIDRPGDRDVFSFTGRLGDEVVAEVYARRLDSPLDSMLRLTDAGGRELAFDDDHEDKGSGLVTHQADSLLAAALPAEGTYYLELGDIQHQGGNGYAYRLHISPPRPGFGLRVVPSSINVLVGSTVPITVYALRRDGFSGDITLALEHAPAGFVLSGGLVPAGQEKVQLTLTVPPLPLDAPVNLRLVGRSAIHGQEILRQAVPADDRMQAFAYHHLVPANELTVSVSGRGARLSAIISGVTVLKIPAGGSARIPVSMRAIRLLENVQFELSDAPEGISVRQVLPGARGAEIVVQCDAARVKPGLRGNLIFRISGERARSSENESQPANRRRIPLGVLPAIPFEIVGQ